MLTTSATDWHWLSTRGYDLKAPADFAFQWMTRCAPKEEHVNGSNSGVGALPSNRMPVEFREYGRGRMTKRTVWEIVPPNLVVFHDECSSTPGLPC